MGLEKSIYHGKEKRKSFVGAKSFVRACRNHGGCSYCEDERTFFDKKERVGAKVKLDDFFKELEEISDDSQKDIAEIIDEHYEIE